MSRTLIIVLSFLNVIVVGTSVGVEQADEVSTYIVHIAHAHAAPPAVANTAHLVHAHYNSFLQGILPPHISEPTPKLIYTYSLAATGFAARMAKYQATHITNHPSILVIYPDERLELYTTQSPSFLGLSPSSGLVQASKGGDRGAVIAVLDTGVYPKGRRSFAADSSLPPPPRTFHGRCDSTRSFNATAYCNNKLVGAKYFYAGHEANMGHPIDERRESKSPLDTEGHGTHTASTAAGSAVPGANFVGYANGTAQGMAIHAHIATYKVCWRLDNGQGSCSSSDILAAMDEAIADRVDVISLSLGGPSGQLYQESTSIGAFNAIRAGIVVSTAAGNDGPGFRTANNLAPWVVTVGASSINRQFPALVVLGNGQSYVGTSLYTGQNTASSFIPLVYGGNAGSGSCESGRLSRNVVAGKIVLCDVGYAPQQEAAVQQAGGFGTIVPSGSNYGDFFQSSSDLFPGSTVTLANARAIYLYIISTINPVARIEFRGTVISQSPSAPRVTAFSGRGPNRFAPEILKPDMIAPGVDIIAAWTGENSPSSLSIDSRRVEFNIISGTSMACPHVSGIAAMLKVAHPSWSPSAIKSAMMTTAYNVDNGGNSIKNSVDGQAAGPFELGSGHVNPNNALDPGLVYNATTDDYITFLCSIGYTPREIAIFARDGTTTDCSSRRQNVGDLNYPAFSMVLGRNGGQVTQRRSVTNVGDNINAVYNVGSVAPPGTTLTVTPQRLAFDAQRKTLNYTITVSGGAASSGTYSWGSVSWSDGQHMVRSPIAVTWQ
uniref:Subtilisin-like protease n=1 Tax=Leersia perrieri TaxID=77586 RepID=A0A0D9VLT8_9ORYZ